jgi:hypothetical protein
LDNYAFGEGKGVFWALGEREHECRVIEHQTRLLLKICSADISV